MGAISPALVCAGLEIDPMRGRSIPLSRPRRIVSDHCHFARKTPLGVIKRTINIKPALEARGRSSVRPGWTALFTKAFALVARDTPAFRQAYVKLPWPQLYEYPISIASLVVERPYQNEDALFLGRIKDPASRSIAEIAEAITLAKTAPVESIRDFNRALQFARVPMLLRRAIWWLGLNIGRQRPNYFGTFGVSVLGGDGASIVYPVSPWTVFLSYGPIAENGDVDVLLAFDHRVMDGAVVSRAFVQIEDAMNGPVRAEVSTRTQ
jgi:hypothetical protein